jgi:hypothetical protein
MYLLWKKKSKGGKKKEKRRVNNPLLPCIALPCFAITLLLHLAFIMSNNKVGAQ